MRRWRTEPGAMAPGQRETLAGLHAAVPPDAAEDDPRFLALLDVWEASGVRGLPVVPAYRTRGGWLISSVPAALAAIGAHCGTGGTW